MNLQHLADFKIKCGFRKKKEARQLATHADQPLALSETPGGNFLKI
jgi:hypothetical protein